MPPKRKAASSSTKAIDSAAEPEQVAKVSSSKRGKKNKDEPKETESVVNSTEVKRSKRSEKKENGSVEEPPKEPAKVKRTRKRTAPTVEEVEENREITEVEEDKEEEKMKETKPKRGKGKKKEPSEDENKKETKPAKSTGLMNKTSTNWENLDFKSSAKNAKGETYKLKISSWNIGGLKSWIKKDCHLYLEYENPDIICLQETKCSEEKLPSEINDLEGYYKYWLGSKKDGYAGVGLLTKIEPIKVAYGIGEPEQDSDGRCITAEYKDFFVVCVYVPNAGRQLVTLPKRLKWNESFKNFINTLDRKKPVIICGDMNVSHNEIDLARPKNNTKNAGFTQEERDGMTDFLAAGYVDTFRELYPDQPDMYTFWTYMGNARAKNVGWRLDYFIVSERIKKNICDSVIRKDVFGSDHCPITLFVNI